MGFSPSFCCLLLLPFVLIHDAQQLRWILLIWATEGLAMLLHFLMWEHECTWQRIEKRLFGHGRKVESNHQLSLLLLPNDIRFYLQKKIETHCLKIVQKRVPLHTVSWTNNRFLCAHHPLTWFCMLDEAKAKKRTRHKSSWWAYKWFWQEVYLLVMLSLLRSFGLFNKSEMVIWWWINASARACFHRMFSPNMTVSLTSMFLAYLTRVSPNGWWFCTTEKQKFFSTLRSTYLTYFYFSDKNSIGLRELTLKGRLERWNPDVVGQNWVNLM